jgi:hypothetical protein
MPALLVEFQDFYREHSESWLDKFSFHESGKQLLLMAFLQRIVNGGGKTTREMAVGRGRTDLVIEYEGDTFVLELKIRHKNYNSTKAYTQLIRYLDVKNQPHGYLILFENKPATEIPWEQRIKWTELEHEWRGIKKQITLVEM